MSRVKAGEPIFLSAPPERDRNLQIYVVFTGIKATRAALETARRHARDLEARLVLLVAKVVPYPLPLDSPPVSNAFTEGVLSQLAAGQAGDITVRVYLCRDREDTIRKALGPGSLVVIGRRKPWWPAPMPLLGRLLKRDGHRVVLV